MNSMVGHAAIGNMWTWDFGLSLGIDWIGVTIPFQSINEVSVETSETLAPAIEGLMLDAEDAADAADAADKVGKMPSFQLAVLRLGYAF